MSILDGIASSRLIPGDMTHAFRDPAVIYKGGVFRLYCTYVETEADGGILLSDPDLAIDWQVPEELRILSEKDKKHPMLKDFDNPFSIDD